MILWDIFPNSSLGNSSVSVIEPPFSAVWANLLSLIIVFPNLLLVKNATTLKMMLIIII